MQLSAKTQNACLAMLEMASRHQDPRPVCLKTIATAHGLSPQFLVQTLLQLKSAGLVTSVRGASGGYRLAKDPEHTNLLEIVEAIDGAPAELPGDDANPLGRALASHWAKVVKRYRQNLAAVNLRTLVESSSTVDMYYI